MQHVVQEEYCNQHRTLFQSMVVWLRKQLLILIDNIAPQTSFIATCLSALWIYASEIYSGED